MRTRITRAAVESAIMDVIEEATRRMFNADPTIAAWGYENYFGAWEIALRLGLELPEPHEWGRWCQEAKESLALARAHYPEPPEATK